MAPDRRWIVIVAAVAALAISGGVLYVRLADRASTPDAPVVQPSQPAISMPAPGAPGMSNVPTIDVAAEKLAKRLAGKDGTADDWALLARSYREMKRYPEALDAYDRALAKTPGNAALAAEAADVRKSAGIAAPR
jgi:cytochrome c-type biogenesis protein CcmH